MESLFWVLMTTSAELFTANMQENPEEILRLWNNAGDISNPKDVEMALELKKACLSETGPLSRVPYTSENVKNAVNELRQHWSVYHKYRAISKPKARVREAFAEMRDPSFWANVLRSLVQEDEQEEPVLPPATRTTTKRRAPPEPEPGPSTPEEQLPRRSKRLRLR